MRASTLRPASMSNNASYLQHAETPKSGTLRNSIPSPAAKQHSFRKQLKLQADPHQQEQHHLVLIESPHQPDATHERYEPRKGEITLKAVKMSRIVGSGGHQGGASGSSEHHHHMVQSPQAAASLMLETIEPIMKA